MSQFSSVERRWLRWILIVAFLIRAGLALRPEFQLPTRPFIEDSFYSLSVARHLAIGDGFTADGIHPTNGVQPLIVLIYAPLFKLAGGDRWAGVRLAHVFSSIVDCVSIYLIALLIAKLRRKKDEDQTFWKSPSIVGALLWAFNYSTFVHTMNGLETGFYSMLLLLLSLVYLDLSSIRARGEEPPLRLWILLGVLLGITVLTRIDAVFFVIILAIFEAVRVRGQGLRNAVVLSGCALIVSSPWWIYNYTQFGSLMPVSGQSESLDFSLAENLYHAGVVFADMFSVLWYVPYYQMQLLTAIWTALMPLVLIVLLWKTNVIDYLKQQFALHHLRPIGIAGLLIVGYYVFFFSAPHFLSRYAHPFRIYWTIAAACALPYFISLFANWGRRYRIISVIAATIVLIAAVGFSFARHGYNYMVSKPVEFYQVAEWALAHPQEVVGMCQSGTTGFICPNVINLDGKVNVDALRARRENRIGEYVIQRRITWLADWSTIVQPVVENTERFGSKFERAGMIANIEMWKKQ
jgi:hypothetical protein